MNIIVLGGNGFIGKNLIKILDNSCKNFSRSKGFNLLDLYQTKQVFKLLAPDVIFNLASHGGSLHYVSKFAADVIDDNLSMYLNLYKAIKELPKKPMVINPISNCAYPGNSSIQMEQDWLNGEVHDSVMAFGNSKRALYHISKCYYKQYGIRSVNLIFPNAFGIYDHLDPNKTHALDGMIIRMLQAKQRDDKTFEVWGSGKPIREWIYSEDFASLLLSFTEKEEHIEPVNMAQGKGYSIKETAEIIKKIIGFEGEIVFNTAYPDGDPVKIMGNPIDFKFTDHEEAIGRTVKYYKGVL
jgi:GDP-L-fucose synthase